MTEKQHIAVILDLKDNVSRRKLLANKEEIKKDMKENNLSEYPSGDVATVSDSYFIDFSKVVELQIQEEEVE